MQDQSSILSLPFILPSQAQKHVTHNEALEILDIVVQLTVSDRSLSTPPANPAEGERYIVANGATGAWADAEAQIATWTDGAWRFIDPLPGWRAEVLSEARAVIFDGADWVVRLPDLDNLSGVGVGTSSDPVNRLAIASPATLLTHEGAGHQLKINKATAGDTASLLYQTGFSGRAEMGLAGNDDWSIKVSPDGSTWIEALRVAAATGRSTGAAVQQSATDITPGRLMRADFGYSRGNILGTVSQVGGVPTGAVIERGANANGSYVRLADGTQICWHRIDMGSITSQGAGTLTDPYRTAAVVWTFPAGFSSVFLPEIIPTPEFAGAPGIRARVVSVAKGSRNANNVFNLQLFRWADTPDPTEFFLSLMAIGRWF